MKMSTLAGNVKNIFLRYYLKQAIAALAFLMFSGVTRAGTPTLDGVYNTSEGWQRIHSGNGNAGWAGTNAKSLYYTSDATYHYFAAEVTASDWMSWAFITNTKAGGATNDSWSRNIEYAHANKPDYTFRGNFGGMPVHTQYHSWNGSGWDGVGTSVNGSGSEAAVNITGANQNGFIEIRVSRSFVSNDEISGVEFYITGNENHHGCFDAVPNDDNANDWTYHSILNNYAATSGPSGFYYVNDNSTFSDIYTTAIGSDENNGSPAAPFATITKAVASASAGNTIYVDAGTYVEDVNVTKQLTILGAGQGVSTVSGAIGGDGATFRISESNITIDGFTITREGNNTNDWNNSGLNSAGIAIQGLTVTGTIIRGNTLRGNRTGIDINNSNGHSILNNTIDNNRTGLIFRNQTDNLTVENNSIRNNWTVGVLFLDGSGGSNSPVQTAASKPGLTCC